MSSAADRLTTARDILRRAGVDADVSRAGPDGEIAAVRAEDRHLPMLADLAPDLRALGFRYVALELNGAEPNQGTT